MRKIRITAGPVQAVAALDANTTADAVWTALPFEAGANTWGAEIYFGISLVLENSADARDVVEAGELGYWPAGRAFCIFFGPTPASRGDEIRAAGAVNVFGRIEGDPGVFEQVPEGTLVRVEKIAESN